MFFTLENFKTALMDDIKQCWSRHHFFRRRYRHRHCRSESEVGKKMKDVKSNSWSWQEMSRMLRRGVLPFVRTSFVVIVVVRIAKLMSMEK
jgi:hypothetical protein